MEKSTNSDGALKESPSSSNSQTPTEYLSDIASRMSSTFFENLDQAGEMFSRMTNKNMISEDLINYLSNNNDETESNASVNSDTNENGKREIEMTTPEMIRHNGYRVEIHKVVTSDDYVLTLHRVLPPDGALDGRHATPVILQHGVLADSTCWMCNGAEHSFAFILVDAGYDVWLGNSRGTVYSREHKSMDPDKNKVFWKYTWQDMAENDLPAIVDYTLQHSTYQQLHYIGHSQGCLLALTALSDDKHDLTNKIASFQGLAPVFKLKHLTDPLKSVAVAVDSWLPKIPNKGMELMGRSRFVRYFVSKLFEMKDLFGSKNPPNSKVLIYALGLHLDHYFEDKLPLCFSNTPAGTSLHNLLHFSQIVTSGVTKKFDYKASRDNLLLYGNSFPPDYDVTNVQVPCYLYFGDLDIFTHEHDRAHLISKLPNIKHEQLLSNFDHMDFIWGRRAPEELYNKVISNMLKVRIMQK